VGGLSGGALPFWSISLAILFAGAARIGYCLVWCETWLDTIVDPVYGCTVDPMGAGRISSDLLLLSRRLLQSLLGRSTGVCRGRTAFGLSRRAKISTYFAERPPILLIPCAVGADGSRHFGIGVGTLVLVLNVILLGGYTFGCHSLRHLVGGRCDQLSSKPVQQTAWKWVTRFNLRHMQFAWMSLFWVGFSDIYIRLCSMGVWTDLRLL
jgi:hypothetical protein